MKKQILLLLCFISMMFCSFVVYGQCGGKKPAWAESSYHRTLDKSYVETVVETGDSYDDVRSKAEAEIQRRRKSTLGEENAWIKSKPLAEYWECGNDRYTGYFLYQTPKNPDPSYKYEDIIVTDRYPFSLRAFVPGMAQLYKGSTTKGALFIVGEAAFIGGIVACEGLRSSYQSKINTTHDVGDRQSNINNADNMQNLRNGFIAGAVLLYAWNVIDGIVAKGKEHVVVRSGNNRLSIAPFVAPQAGSMATGLSLAYNF